MSGIGYRIAVLAAAAEKCPQYGDLRIRQHPHSVTCPHLTCTGRREHSYLCSVGGVTVSSRKVEYIIVEINTVRRSVRSHYVPPHPPIHPYQIQPSTCLTSPRSPPKTALSSTNTKNYTNTSTPTPNSPTKKKKPPRSLLLSGGEHGIFLEDPIAIGLLGAALFFVLVSLAREVKDARSAKRREIAA